MTHVSNGIQELHDKIQASLTHTVECEARFNCSKSEQNILDECFGQLTDKERTLNNCLVKSVDKPKNKMGNTFQVKQDSSGNSAVNKGTVSEDINNEKNISSTSSSSICNSAPVIILNHSNTNSRDSTMNELKPDAKIEPTEKDQNNVSDSLCKTVVEEGVCCVDVHDLESSRSSFLKSGNSLCSEEIITLHRDSAYGSSSESGCNPQGEPVSVEPTDHKHEAAEPLNSNNHLLSTAMLNDSATLASKWSSSSSLASDSAAEMQTNIDETENGTYGGLLCSKESNHLKNLSSSTFSLR